MRRIDARRELRTRRPMSKKDLDHLEEIWAAAQGDPTNPFRGISLGDMDYATNLLLSLEEVPPPPAADRLEEVIEEQEFLTLSSEEVTRLTQEVLREIRQVITEHRPRFRISGTGRA